MDVIREILPHFRKNGKGMVVNIGSQRGTITFPLMSPYHATKFALEVFTESFAYELATINVIVKLIEPGGATTSFFKNSQAPAKPVPTAYSRIVNSTGVEVIFEKYKDKLATTAEAAAFIYNAVTNGTDNLRCLIGEEIVAFLDVKEQKSDAECIKVMSGELLPK